MSNPVLVIDLRSSVPLEEQIRQAIRQRIASGELGDGTPLPSVRQLAGDLSVHWNTVARAYRRLQDEGLLIVGQGRGVFVKAPAPRLSPDSGAREGLAAKLREVFTDARLHGISDADLRALILDELDRWNLKEIRP
jgi:GntR family transcriptional regulator